MTRPWISFTKSSFIITIPYFEGATWLFRGATAYPLEKYRILSVEADNLEAEKLRGSHDFTIVINGSKTFINLDNGPSFVLQVEGPLRGEAVEAVGVYGKGRGHWYSGEPIGEGPLKTNVSQPLFTITLKGEGTTYEATVTSPHLPPFTLTGTLNEPVPPFTASNIVPKSGSPLSLEVPQTFDAAFKDTTLTISFAQGFVAEGTLVQPQNLTVTGVWPGLPWKGE